jgi:pimeloyl-ACP methyl ester carboxylesterase
MNTYILVHGAWQGAWCWEKVIAQLQKAGHTAVAVELPAHGADQTPVSGASLGSYVQTVAQVIERQTGPVILVGHSMAGVVISAVAERMPDRVAALIYVAAYLLQNGETVVQVSQAGTDSVVGANMEFAPDYSTVGVKTDALREAFAADASDADFGRLSQMYKPEPTGPFNTPLLVTAERFGRVPRRYIRTAQDRAVTPMLQDAMLANVPCERVITMETSHSPFLSAPEELASNIVALSSASISATR